MQWEEKCDIPRKVNYCLCAPVESVGSWLKGCNQGLFWCFSSAATAQMHCGLSIRPFIYTHKHGVPHFANHIAPKKVHRFSFSCHKTIHPFIWCFFFPPPALHRDKTGAMSSIKILHQDWHNNSQRVYFLLKVTVSTRRLERLAENDEWELSLCTPGREPAGTDTGEPRDKTVRGGVATTTQSRRSEVMHYLDLNRGKRHSVKCRQMRQLSV